jgi:hypothetical protein
MSNMSFREKSAWISFVLILALAVIYFGRTIAWLAFGSSHPPAFLFPVLVGAVIVLEVALHLLLRMRAPQDARTPRDEREALIALKARSVAYPVVAVCAFASIATLHLGASRFQLAEAVLFAVIVGEVSRCGAQIVYFRRGA